MKAVLICAHGSSENSNGDAAASHAEYIRNRTSVPVYCCYHEHQKPSSKEIVSLMAADGVDEIVAIPLFFAPGFLANRMLPKELGMEPGQLEGEVVVNGKTILIHITGVFGNHPLMKDVMKEIMEKYTYPVKDTSVILIGHGSKDPANSKTVEFNASFVRDMGYRTVCAYNEMQTPTVEDALELAIKSKTPHIIAIPMFVSPSNHSVNEIPEKLGLDENRRRIIETENGTVELEYAEEVGLSPGISEILLERSREY